MSDAPECCKKACEPRSVREQARDIERDCERAAIRSELVSAKWDRRNLWLGLLSAIAAAVAAFAAGGDSTPSLILPERLVGYGKLIVPFFALLSAILTSALTFLAPSKRAESFHESSNKYLALREQLRLFINSRASEDPSNGDEKSLSEAAGEELKTDQETVSEPVKKDSLARFVAEKQDIDVSHPIIPEWAYVKAHRRLIKKKIWKEELKWIEKELKNNYVPPENRWQRLWVALAGRYAPRRTSK